MTEPKPLTTDRRAEIEWIFGIYGGEGPLWEAMEAERFWREAVRVCMVHRSTYCNWCNVHMLSVARQKQSHDADCPWLLANQEEL